MLPEAELKLQLAIYELEKSQAKKVAKKEVANFKKKHQTALFEAELQEKQRREEELRLRGEQNNLETVVTPKNAAKHKKGKGPHDVKLPLKRPLQLTESNIAAETHLSKISQNFDKKHQTAIK